MHSLPQCLHSNLNRGVSGCIPGSGSVRISSQMARQLPPVNAPVRWQ
jgi:hypothetical protein